MRKVSSGARSDALNRAAFDAGALEGDAEPRGRGVVILDFSSAKLATRVSRGHGQDTPRRGRGSPGSRVKRRGRPPDSGAARAR